MSEKRALITGLLLLALFMAVIGRLAYLVFAAGETLSAAAVQQNTRSLDYYQYARGDIYDRLGRRLTGADSVCLVVYPSMLDDTAAVAERLALLLGEDGARTAELLQAGMANMPAPFILKTGLDMEQAAAVEEAQLAGVFVLELAARYAADAPAAHLLGRVAPLGEGGAYIGVSGLEAAYEQLLSGRVDARVVANVDAAGNISRQQLYLDIPSEKSTASIQLTLDLDYQQLAERALEGHSGACVLLEAASGDIAAMVSAPGFDPYGWRDAADGAYLNKALCAYPPASAFKLLLAIAALDSDAVLPQAADMRLDAEQAAAEEGAEDSAEEGAEGGATADEPPPDGPYSCAGYYALGSGLHINCWQRDGHGEIDLQQALIYSCNSYFIALGQKLGGAVIEEYARRCGLLDLSIGGYEIEAEDYLRFNRQVEGDIANVSIGEQGVRLTPLTLAQLYCIVANGGYRVWPRLVSSISDAQGTLTEIEPHTPERVISAEHAGLLQQTLIAAVQQGTGGAAADCLLGGGGKTGTSEDAGVWFVGFAPEEQPRWVLAVYIEDADSAAVAAECWQQIIDDIAILEGLAE
ncbi:MAG: penicillin-binding transpeptidase domain-containing protein [Bacillota bacterium]|nr:penicillin-binding transpeptidase domain-containing protein [Bacillota bacterium]